MIKTKLQNLYNLNQSKNWQDFIIMKFKASIAYDVNKIIESIVKEVEGIEKIRNDLIKKLGTEITKENLEEFKKTFSEVVIGNFLIDNPKSKEEFSKEMTELFSKDVVINHNQLSRNDLGDNIVSPFFFNDLGFLFEE